MGQPQAKPHRRRSRGPPRGAVAGSSCVELSAWLTARYRAQEAAACDPSLERSTAAAAGKALPPQLTRTRSAPSDPRGRHEENGVTCLYRTLTPAKNNHASFLVALRKAVAAQTRSPSGLTGRGYH